MSLYLRVFIIYFIAIIMNKPYRMPSVKIVSLKEVDVITTSEVEVDPDAVVDYESKSPRRSMWDNN